jgi:MoxR-like ATPase
VAVLAHRLLPTAQAQLNRRTAEQVVLEILQRTPVPAAPQSPSSGLGMGRGSSAFGQQPPRRL